MEEDKLYEALKNENAELRDKLDEKNAELEKKKQPNIYEKLNCVQEELKAPKNQRNTFGNYNYRSCEDILEAVKPLLKKYRLNLTIRDDIDERNGRYYIKSFATLVDIDNPSEKIITTAEAREAENKKGLDDSQVSGLTSSYSRKYLVGGLFLLDDTKDADTDEYVKQTTVVENKPQPAQPTPQAQPQVQTSVTISEAQAKRLFALSGGDQELVRLVINEHGYTSSRDIKKVDYDTIASEIELKSKGVEVNVN